MTGWYKGPADSGRPNSLSHDGPRVRPRDQGEAKKDGFPGKTFKRTSVPWYVRTSNSKVPSFKSKWTLYLLLPPAFLSPKSRTTGRPASDLHSGLLEVCRFILCCCEQMAELPVFTGAEVASHSSEGDCYTVVNGFVYNVTKYLRSAFAKCVGGVGDACACVCMRVRACACVCERELGS